MQTILNHVAILVGEIEAVLKKSEFPSGLIGEMKEFASYCS